MPALFAAQAARTPEATALTCDGVSLSYAELDEAANRIAHRLLALGAGPGTIVALMLERCVRASHRCAGHDEGGAAYLPLDPAYPRSRLQLMVEDAGAALLLTTVANVDNAPEGCRVVALDAADEQALLAALPKHAPSEVDLGRPLLADDLAYLIYTSGSTGAPKGVTVPHQNVVRLFAATERLVRLRRRRCLDAVPLLRLRLLGLGALGCACSMVAGWSSCPSETHARPGAFLDMMARERVTVLNQTPLRLLRPHGGRPHGRDVSRRLEPYGL